MAKKKLIDAPLKYYAFYDNKTGSILSVSNEKTNEFEYGIEISSYEAVKLISGEWKFVDYVVGRKKQPDGTTIKCVMPFVDQEYAFRNNVFEWIEETNKKCELIVEWDFLNKHWTFSVDSNVKLNYKSELLLSKLIFFVTLENDFDFLIRTIYIDLNELLDTEKVTVAFNTNKELDIRTISISSKVVFKSYGLKVLYE